MRKISYPLAVLVALLQSTSVFASQELSALIRCHEALNDKSDGKSTKLSLDAATPFVIPSGKNLYFVTKDSVAVLANKFSSQDIIIQLQENNTAFFRKVSFQKSGELGSISYEEVSTQDKKTALTASTQLDENSLNIIKKELVRRMNSVTGEYQNKYNPARTIEALNICKDVKSPELQTSLEKQVQFYQKLGKGKYSGKTEKPKNSGGTR